MDVKQLKIYLSHDSHSDGSSLSNPADKSPVGFAPGAAPADHWTPLVSPTVYHLHIIIRKVDETYFVHNDEVINDKCAP